MPSAAPTGRIKKRFRRVGMNNARRERNRRLKGAAEILEPIETFFDDIDAGGVA